MTERRDEDAWRDESAYYDDRSIEEREMENIVSKDDIEELRTDMEILGSYVGDLFQGLFILFAYLFGSSLAMVISYSHNNSIPWGIGHGILSWGYVLYFAIFK
jgi:hypothetical protein